MWTATVARVVGLVALVTCLQIPVQVRSACYPGLGDCSNKPEQPPPPPAEGTQYYYVGPVFPPDPWLALRSEPSSTSGYQIMKMPEGTLFRRLEVRGQWYKLQLRDGQIGWAHSGWIKCCRYVKD